MNASERYLFHAAITDIERITTQLMGALVRDMITKI